MSLHGAKVAIVVQERVPVDDARDVRRAERRFDGAMLDVHDRLGLGGGGRPAPAPQQAREAATQRVRKREKRALVPAVCHVDGSGRLHTVTRDRTKSARWIVADVRLAPGNSGGPLVDAEGRLIGINSMVVNGLGVAVPASLVQQFVERALSQRAA